MNLLNLPPRHHHQRDCRYLLLNAKIVPAHQPRFLYYASQSKNSRLSLSLYSFTRYAKTSNTLASAAIPFSINLGNEEKEKENVEEFEEYLAEDGEVYQKTLRLVECAMFSAVSGLAFLLSNSLAIEKYFACFFALPIVLSTMRWGVSAGRKTMVATSVLLFILSGPVKALTYLLLHGLLGFTMGAFWRLRASWGVSVFLCSLVRALGAVGYVLISSFLIGENILALITINIHATLTYILTSMGFNAIPSMNTIYSIFGILLMLNCAFFVFLLHLLYAVFFTRLGMKTSLRLPRWLAAAI